MGIEFTVNVKKRFIVNGKEYGSVEEMPEEFRAAYAKAIESAAAQGHARTLNMGKCQIAFHGKDYSIEDSLPEGDREADRSPIFVVI